ncbi:unnamed protein product [Protopolystoma xenopodis]|uniref:protein-tyrosine-phosphatase n=1 Tax=Protopolystoma xenopodis TaxID=117903 RepID=A0A3S5CIE2_9PLAT|nr:unnamed protein product [Protopolystoma xenopodis]
MVNHFHYINWPDFGVPTSPAGMLNFLWRVRESGALDSPDKPPIVHCSAGVGRSGTFVFVDLALELLVKPKLDDATSAVLEAYSGLLTITRDVETNRDVLAMRKLSGHLLIL